jgi:hypothetical protein
MFALLTMAAALTMDQPIHFDQCSHHAPQSEVRVGTTALGAYGVEWKTTTYYGTCVAYEVLDFGQDRFLTTESFGPDCPIGPVMMLAPEVFDKNAPEFEPILDSWIETLDEVARGYACHPPRPELKPLIEYLLQLKLTPPPA